MPVELGMPVIPVRLYVPTLPVVLEPPAASTPMLNELLAVIGLTPSIVDAGITHDIVSSVWLIS